MLDVVLNDLKLMGGKFQVGSLRLIFLKINGRREQYVLVVRIAGKSVTCFNGLAPVQQVAAEIAFLVASRNILSTGICKGVRAMAELRCSETQDPFVFLVLVFLKDVDVRVQLSGGLDQVVNTEGVYNRWEG